MGLVSLQTHYAACKIHHNATYGTPLPITEFVYNQYNNIFMTDRHSENYKGCYYNTSLYNICSFIHSKAEIFFPVYCFHNPDITKQTYFISLLELCHREVSLH